MEIGFPTVIAIWLFMAFLVEKITAYILLLIPAIGEIQISKFNFKLMLALVVAIVLAFGADLNFFTMFEIEFRIPIIGYFLTAIFMSGGANAVHDILKLITNVKEIFGVAKNT